MKENVSINLKGISGFVPYEEVVALAQLSLRHLEAINGKTGAGNDFLGWVKLP